MSNETTTFKVGKKVFHLQPVARDNRIDTLRGLFLILMAVGHFGGWITKYTWECYGYNSNAEGFVFISGFVFAMVYGRYIIDYRLLARRVLMRSFTVYKYHFLLVIILPFIALIIPLYRSYWKFMLSYFFVNGSPCEYLVSSILMLNQPTFMDVLPMYAVFILLSWPLLILLSRGHDFLAMSICLLFWITGQFFNPIVYLANIFFPNAFPGLFNVFSWQLLFFLGVFFGFKKKFNHGIGILRNKLVAIVICVIYIIIFLAKYKYISLGFDTAAATVRTDLGWLRLVSFMSLAFVVALLIKPIPLKYGIPWVSFLGKHSLQVFSFHIFILYFIIVPLGKGNGIYNNYGNSVYVISLILFLLSLSLPALGHKIYIQRIRKKGLKG